MGRKKKSDSSDSTKKKKLTAREREELLIHNFVGLQHVMTNLSIKFENLSEQIVKLLEVFEEAAKKFVVKNTEEESDKDLLNKIDSLLDQNKTIAKGLVLMEEKLRNRTTEPANPSRNTSQSRPLPKI